MFNSELEVFYRVLDFRKSASYAHKPKILIEPTFTNQPRYFYDYNRSSPSGTSSLFTDGLNVNGNIARGLGFGNNQDVVLNSNLNLQLNGNLGKGITVLAAISDENNPIQPQGNTQQIQDFDKVFISVQKDSNTITVGDFLMQSNPHNYFMKYYKKSRGVQFDFNTKKPLVYNFHSDAAVSRGRFVRNEIQGQEGNQGPYRLQGTNGELNIIVISGTEVVYVDGEKLERGQQNDYVIDYNTGEIVFMPRKLITKFNRIVVEFQYSDRNYSRSVFTAGNEFRSKKWLSSVNYFSEQDNKLQPTDTSNSSTIQTKLENSGDNQAVYQFERRYSQFQPDRVNYRKTDSLGFDIYLYTNAPESDTVFYTTAFSLVGQGVGNYVQVATSANGRVYAWVAPVGGVPQGNYEPYVVLVAPKRMQMLTVNTRFAPNEYFEFSAEGAYTNNNQNTYSRLDKYNDDGLGIFLSARQKDFKFRDLRISSSAKMEYITRNFAYVERYRSVEFNRIWNRQLSNNTNAAVRANETISTLNTVLNYKEKHLLLLEGSNYNKDNIFSGFRGFADYTYNAGKLLLHTNAEQVHIEDRGTPVLNKNQAYHYTLDGTYTLSKFRIGAAAGIEESKFTSDTSVKLGTSSFQYQQVSAFIEGLNSTKWQYKLEGSLRSDFTPDSGGFSFASTGVNLLGNLGHVTKRLNRFNIVGSYRQLDLAGNTNDDQVILGRIEYNANFFKKVVTSSTYYQIGTGREQKRQFSFALVQPGNGTHFWIDYNNNGIQEINEFELAVYKDQGTYVKVFLPTNEFIKSNTNEFNQTFRIQAPISWQNGNRFRRTISRFNTITSYKADRRITDNRLETIINPFKLNVSDSSLIAVNSLIKQTTFFNRSNARFGIEHNLQTQKGKQFLSSGFEWRQYDKNNVIVRFGFSRKINLVVNGELSLKQNRNDFFENRNYKYNARIIHPEIFYQTEKGIRVGTYVKYTEALNAPEYGNDQAFIREFGLDFRYFIINRGNIDAKIATHQINFNGNVNSPLAFDVLNGLSNGSNLTWNVSFGGKAKGNIQINLSYEGRKTQVFKTIHIGRAEARYIF
jgi:hypothetical protein